jgi:hypothetical protein
MSKPERIGGYTIERELGRGGMGVVWLGHDEKLDRPVAIEVLSREWPDDELRLRFEREVDRWAGWDVAPDGRFALIEPAPWELVPERLHVAVNRDREIPSLLAAD